ncbi:anti-sigma factor [Nocardioides bizhenqiangii]|uniref:Regulator of SigK n=1 Tax=Nocardioides bizhenqiangii TaxID=3095076 RepID=A0ABZ0ZSI9_9ACTN|nr:MULTISPECIES: anti-sigma factor [unclassified Nocardioides]MDZ5619231.1 anti-sigma factor [Nocardioides sp. HM23]WQQ26746.1 anti-sigma factor [Nocardioides sp. HM61]
MSDLDETRPDWDNAHALTGAYVVDALDDVERARFEAHLRSCPDCRIEVETLRETAAALAVDPVEPPARLRAEVLAGIETIRPLPPHIERGSEATDDRTRRRPWFASTGPLLVAAALVVVALLTTVWLKPWASDDDTNLSATEAVLQADDREDFEQQFPDGSSATVVVSRSEGRAVVITDDMAPAPDGKVYELWLQDPAGSMVPAGLMPDQDDATVLLEGDASEATAVGITIEPDGGSAEPGPDVVAVIEITA